MNDFNISIVIASHNGGKYIGELLDSILDQTYPFHEIIISDDGSTDNTISIVSTYMKKDNRIKLFKHIVMCKNPQYAHELVKDNFVYGFKKTTGNVIAPTDQDDIWMPNRLEKLVSMLSDTIDVVNAQDKILFENGETKEDILNLSDIYETIWYHGLKGHTCIFKKELLDLYDHCGLVAWDYTLALYCCLTRRYVTLSDYLILWRRHPSAVTFVAQKDDMYYRENVVVDKVGKRIKIKYVNKSLLCNKKHPSLSEYFVSRYNLINYVCSNYNVIENRDVVNNCCKVVRECAKQTILSFFMAGIYNIKALQMTSSYKTLSIKRKLYLCLDAFSRPYTFFYEQKDCVELF